MAAVGETRAQREARLARQAQRYPELGNTDAPTLMAIDRLRRSEGRAPTSMGLAAESVYARIRHAPPPTPGRPREPGGLLNDAFRALNEIGDAQQVAGGGAQTDPYHVLAERERRRQESQPLSTVPLSDTIGRVAGAFDAPILDQFVDEGSGPLYNLAREASRPSTLASALIPGGPGLRAAGYGARLAAETVASGLARGAGDEIAERSEGLPAPLRVGLPIVGGLAAGAAGAGAVGGVRSGLAGAGRRARVAAPFGGLDEAPLQELERAGGAVAARVDEATSARQKIVNALTEERRLRATGVAGRELREGRSVQAARIRTARASGLSGEALLRAQEQAASVGTLRKTFPVPDLDDAEFDAMLDALNAAPSDIVGDFDALSLGRALSDWRRGTRPPQPAQIEALGRVLGGEVEGLSKTIAQEAREFAEDQGLIRQTRELLDNLEARRTATAVARREREAGQAIDRRVRQLGDLPDLAPPPRPQDSTLRLAALDPGAKPNKAKAPAIRRAQAQAETWQKANAKVAAGEAAEAQKQRDIIRQMEDLNGRQAVRGEAQAARAAKRADVRALREERDTARLNAREQQIVEATRRTHPTEGDVLRQVDERVKRVDPAAVDDAREVVKVWTRGNRDLLDRLDTGQGFNPFRQIEAAIRGDVTDPFLNGVLVRESLLVNELKRAGVDVADAKTIARKMTQRELMLRSGAANPQAIPAAWTETLAAARNVPYEQAVGGLVTLNQQAKSTMFGLADIGIFGQQANAAIQNGGIPAMVGAMNRLMALAHLPHATTLIDDVALPKRAQYALDGLSTGIASSGLTPQQGTLLRRLGAPGRKVDDFVTPIVEAWSNFQFDTILGSLRTLVYEGDLVMAKMIGEDITSPLVRHRAAQNANHITSFANTATKVTRAQVESLAFTSPAMNRARVARVMDVAKLLSPSAKVGKQERLQAATMVASQVLITMLGGKLMHDAIGVGDFEWDPSKPSYGRFVMRFKDAAGRNIVWDYLPQDSIQRAFAQSIRAITEADPDALALAWTRAGIGSISPVARIPATGLGFGFDPEGGYRIGEFPTSTRQALGEFAPAPPIAGSALRGETDPRYLGAEFAAFSAYPESGPAAIKRGEELGRLAADQGFSAINTETWRVMGEQEAFASDIGDAKNLYEWRQNLERDLRAQFEAQGMQPGQIRTELDKAVTSHPLYKAYLDLRMDLRTQWVIDHPREAVKLWNEESLKPWDERKWDPSAEQKRIMIEWQDAAP